MCRIYSIYNKSSIRIQEDRIIRMRDIMLSRCPDDEAVYIYKYKTHVITIFPILFIRGSGLCLFR